MERQVSAQVGTHVKSGASFGFVILQSYVQIHSLRLNDSQTKGQMRFSLQNFFIKINCRISKFP